MRNSHRKSGSTNPVPELFRCAAILMLVCAHCMRLSGPSALEKGFTTPPREARPDVLWWWLNSFVTKEGITRDLEAMKQKGIGGALIFDASPVDRWQDARTRQVPVGPAFMSPEWRVCFRHAVKEADRLGIELGVSITSGFNAGGPWVTPEFGQQELVWSEHVIEGGTPFSGTLPLPAGPIYGDQGEPLRYQEMEVNNDLERDSAGKPVYYRDAAVIAVPLPAPEPTGSGRITNQGVLPGRVKNWPLKSVRSFHYPEKDGYRFETGYEDVQDLKNESRISSRSVIDLAAHVNPDGRLNWTPPEGKWLILRFGHTFTGVMLQATNPMNTGLAINHLSAEAAEKHFTVIAEKMAEDVRRVRGNSLTYFYLDSWEVRIANWTPGFRDEFHKRRGYELMPYLPVLAGRIVDSREVSNRFLHDYRETIGDLIADHYYGRFRELSRRSGFQFRSEMATTPIPVDMLKCLGRCDMPVGEFWAETSSGKGRNEPWERMFGKQAASAAHIYGVPFAAAEALTVIDNHWEFGPFQLKRTLDQAFCSGLNRLEIHTFTHSPPDVPKPGYEYFAGTHFNPQITWWEQARAFTDYIGRCQFMLQQGRFTADVCFYQGGRVPNFVPNKHIDPRLGPGYDYDVINTEALLTRVSVSGACVVLPDGMRYRLLVLPEDDSIDLRVLEKIEDLVRDGATVAGPKPQKTYGLSGYPGCDSTVQALAGRLWGDDTDERIKERRVGKGRIVWGRTPREILLRDGVRPDFLYENPNRDIQLDWIHRTVEGAGGRTDIYFVANLKETWAETACTFRVSGRLPEIWDPETGTLRRAAVYT